MTVSVDSWPQLLALCALVFAVLGIWRDARLIGVAVILLAIVLLAAR